MVDNFFFYTDLDEERLCLFLENMTVKKKMSMRGNDTMIKT